MRQNTLAIFAACAAVTIFGQAQAQQPAATPAAVPDQMPFDIPYGNSITADRAADVVKAVLAEATKTPRNWKLAISVVDTHGDLVYFYKMDNTQQASVTISQNKARTAARFRRPTQLFSNAMQAPTGGNQFLIAQNGPIIAHTADGVAFTSALRVMVAAEAGAIAILRMAVRPSTAKPVSGSFGSLGNFLIGSPYHLKVECAARHLSPACGDRGRVRFRRARARFPAN